MGNPHVQIKICGVRSIQIAKTAAELGANYIGIIFHPYARRYVSPIAAKDIVKAIKDHGATPVAVFVDHHFNEMLDICLLTHINMVQLHGRIAKLNHAFLPDNFSRIYVRPVSSQGKLVSEDESLDLLKCERDFLLFDYETPGSGTPFNWDLFQHVSPFRIGLAGGLHIKNVHNAIVKYQPYFVDISTHVENLMGDKEPGLIKNFIEAVKHSAGGKE